MESTTEPIDEDEQNDIISLMIHDVKKQIEQMSNILKIVCNGAAVAGLVSTLCHTPESDEYKLLITFFPYYSSLVHFIVGKTIQSSSDGITIRRTGRRNNVTEIVGMGVGTGIETGTGAVGISRSFVESIESISIIGFIITLSQMAIFFLFNISDALVWSLSVTNLMTIAASIYFRYDTKRTLLSVQDMKSSKYKFKSL